MRPPAFMLDKHTWAGRRGGRRAYPEEECGLEDRVAVVDANGIVEELELVLQSGHVVQHVRLPQERDTKEEGRGGGRGVGGGGGDTVTD